MKTTASTMKAPVPKSRRLTAAQPRVSTETPTALRSQRARLASFASTLFFISRAAAGLKSLGLVILASHNARRRRQRAENWLKPSDAAQKRLVTGIRVARTARLAFLEYSCSASGHVRQPGLAGQALESVAQGRCVVQSAVLAGGGVGTGGRPEGTRPPPPR